MITINLLPPEHREAPPTSTGRMLSIAGSVAIAIVPIIFYAMTHYIDLPKMQKALAESQQELAVWNAKQIPQRHGQIFQLAATLSKRETTVENIRQLKTEMARKMAEHAEIIIGHKLCWTGGLFIKKQEQRVVRRSLGRPGIPQPTQQVKIPEYEWEYKVRTVGDNLQTAINYYRQIKGHEEFWKDFVSIKTPEYDKYTEKGDGFQPFSGYEFDINMTMQMNRDKDE